MATLERPPEPPGDTAAHTVYRARRRRFRRQGDLEPREPTVYRSGRRGLLIALGSVGALALVGAATATVLVLRFPEARLVAAPQALARLEPAGWGTRITTVRLTRADGSAVPLRLTAKGWLWPQARVRAGERLRVSLVVRRPGWAAWLVGAEQHERLTVVAPAAGITNRWLGVRPGASLRIRFDRPVRVVEIRRDGRRWQRTLRTPRRAVELPPALTVGTTGRVHVAAAPRAWERLSKPVNVDWFPASGATTAIVKPALGSPLGAGQPLVLTLSRPIADVFGHELPTLRPAVDGGWRALDSHTLAFVPAAHGFAFDRSVTVQLPRSVVVAGGRERVLSPRAVLRWHVGVGSQARLEQLLAQLGYLPLVFTPRRRLSATYTTQLKAAFAPPRGSWRWRWRHVPAALRAMWKPGVPDQLDHGALMAFESEHALPVDGVADAQVWRALLRAVADHARRPASFTYVQVSERIPETLRLWHNGRTVLRVPANTGISVAPTAPGTFWVYAHLPVGTMAGTNPDGSHYNDPGIQYISYFNGGDAIHAFDRASFGTPQSLGCVELQLDDAARVYPYTPIGTLVTVA